MFLFFSFPLIDDMLPKNRNFVYHNSNSPFLDYYSGRINLKSLRQKSLYYFFLNCKHISKNSFNLNFALVVLTNPVSLQMFNFIADDFSFQLRKQRLVSISFIPVKIQSLFTCSKNSNTFLIATVNIISLFMFLDFLLRLKLNFLVKKISSFEKKNILVKEDDYAFYNHVYNSLQCYKHSFIFPNEVKVYTFTSLLIFFAIQLVRNFVIINLLRKKDVNAKTDF